MFTTTTACPATAPSAVDVSQILAEHSDPSLDDEFPFGQGLVDGDRPFVTLGTPAQVVVVDSSTIIDSTTDRPLVGGKGTPFNLATLKLPRGSQWGFVGVARGPTRFASSFSINGMVWREQCLVAYGLNLTADGTLVAVTPGHTLDLPMKPKEGCLFAGIWAGTFGPEDARLFWTDGGTPAMTYGMLSTNPGTCRSVGLINDLRDVFPQLAAAMRDSSTTYVPGAIIDGAGGREMLRRDESLVEKNWMAFYPGASPTGALIPHIHYTLNPAWSLVPSRDVSSRRIIYDDQLVSDYEVANCVAEKHAFSDRGRFHQATPLYRLTLCERGPLCVPGIHNTVFITLAHLQGNQGYARFVVLLNVTAPFAPISVGPMFQFNGINDTTVHYTLTMTALEEADINPAVKPAQLPCQSVDLPGHAFIDDAMLVTFGSQETYMGSTIIPVLDLVARQRQCGREW